MRAVWTFSASLIAVVAVAGVGAAPGESAPPPLSQPAGEPGVQPPESQPRGTNAGVDAELLGTLQKLDERIGKIKDLRAKFEQRKTSPLLRRPMVSSGELIARGGVVLWRTETPRATEMRVGEKEIRLFYPGDKLIEIYPIAHAKAMAGGPLPRLADLKAQFTFARPAPEEGRDPAAFEVVLTPIAEDMRRSVATVRVTIDESVPCVSKIVLTDPEGEQTTVEFRDIKLNTGVKAEEVELNPPKGTRESRPLEGMKKEHRQPTSEGDRTP